MSNLYLVWLEWAEKCFRVDAKALRCLRGLVPASAKIVRVKGEAAFLKALPKATHVITWSFRPEWFARASRLKVLATPAAGRELVPEVGPKGVEIHFGHFHGRIIAESVLGFMLCWAKGFFAVDHAPRSCATWPRTWLSKRCYDIAGTKAVIVGYGHVGREIGRCLEAMGVEVLGVTRHGVFKDSRRVAATFRPAKVLAAADWLILALPSTTGTDDFLDAEMIGRLPRQCVVINVGRGNAVDERALAAALNRGRIAGAYLDVRRCEKSQSSSSSVQGLRRGKSNLVLMPHSSAFSPNYLKMCFEELRDDGML